MLHPGVESGGNVRCIKLTFICIKISNPIFKSPCHKISKMEQTKKGTLWNYDLQVLRSMLGMQVTDEQLQSIVERAIQEADLDEDNAISFDEFRKVNY